MRQIGLDSEESTIRSNEHDYKAKLEFGELEAKYGSQKMQLHQALLRTPELNLRIAALRRSLDLSKALLSGRRPLSGTNVRQPALISGPQFSQKSVRFFSRQLVELTFYEGHFTDFHPGSMAATKGGSLSRFLTNAKHPVATPKTER